MSENKDAHESDTNLRRWREWKRKDDEKANKQSEGKGWHEKKDPSLGKARRHHEVAIKGKNDGLMTKAIKPAKTDKKIKVGTQVRFNKNSERVQQILPYHKGYENKVGVVDDHAKDAETAKQWAINTINEWGT